MLLLLVYLQLSSDVGPYYVLFIFDHLWLISIIRESVGECMILKFDIFAIVRNFFFWEKVVAFH